jgi:hypothetical protein
MRQLVSSASQLESSIGFSRAVRVGSWVAVAGTAPIAVGGGVACPGEVVKGFIDPEWLVEIETDCIADHFA